MRSTTPMAVEALAAGRQRLLVIAGLFIVPRVFSESFSKVVYLLVFGYALTAGRALSASMRTLAPAYGHGSAIARAHAPSGGCCQR
jgi:hypothetical protein